MGSEMCIRDSKITIALRGICLSSQLYGRAKDLCIGLSSDQLSTNNGVDLIISKIHQRDPITVVSDVYRDFTDLITTKRGTSETFRNFESRYAAQISKYNANGNSIQFSEALSALMLLSNSGIDDSQRISILSSVATSNSEDVPDGSETVSYTHLTLPTTPYV